jgi:hypothetical protein
MDMAAELDAAEEDAEDEPDADSGYADDMDSFM